MSPRKWTHAPIAAMLCGLLLLAACGKSPGPAPSPPPATAEVQAVPEGAFGLARIEVESYEGRPAAPFIWPVNVNVITYYADHNYLA